ncbi:glycosyltransferase family protein [Sandaracinus amylolyticus]|uniref:glycosyltransferase family protein n=1 Tax=Sandaracinus amylolyticus TaxID=927083 RepID=UPI00069CE9A7|nr:glycosyltransferase [Sandaracinus amylolyticus]
MLFWYSALARAKAVASCRYRIGNLAEVGHRVNVVIAEALPARALESTDALVVVRPYPTRHVLRALASAQRLGVTRIADYDDLLFAGSAEERPEVQSGGLTREWMERAHRAYASMLPAFDGYTAATDELAGELRAACPGAPVFVVPNGLSPAWIEQGRALYPRWWPGDSRVMRFFPGSPTHDASFAAIASGLAEWMRAHDDTELEIVGNLAWDASGFPSSRVRRIPAVPFDHLPRLLASAWVNLWPRAETRFNRCKSPIKFLEAAAFGCPTVASPSCARPELDCEGLVHATTADDWATALTRWRDDDARMRASESCMRFADERGGADRGWRALQHVVRSLRSVAA